MPLILPARTLDSGYEIDNSLRFFNGDYLKDTSFGTGTNRKKFTFSFWIKMTNLDTGGNPQVVYSNDENDQIGFTGDQKFRFVDSGSVILQTNRFFRDVSAWYHIVLAVDTTQGTGSNRYKLYVNGTQETSLETDAGITQNTDLNFHNNETHAIGRSQYDGNRFLYAYLSEFHAIDGQQLDASYFGETNDNGVWIPKEYTGTYGNNGIFMEFKQSGTGQSSSSMGADTSGNDNHFVTVALDATNQTTDTPTNNFATLKIARTPPSSGAVLSEGNTHFVTGSTGGARNMGRVAYGNIPVNKGKWYYEVKIGHEGLFSGVSAEESAHIQADSNNSRYAYFYSISGEVYINTSGSETDPAYGPAGSANDVLGFAMDADNMRMYVRGSGGWSDGSGNFDEADINGFKSISFSGASTDLEGYVVPSVCSSAGGTSMSATVNFGNPAFAISSGNADANGYGNFEYAVPSGYYALCTKNLAEYG